MDLDLYNVLDLPTDDEVVRAILSLPVHFFTPRASKNSSVTYGGATVTAKKWTVTPEISGEADVTNFEGVTINGPDGTPIMIERKLACTIKTSFTIELDGDALANLYDAGLTAGNSITQLKLFLNKAIAAGCFWSFPTPYFKSVPNVADVKTAIAHTITGEGSATFLYPTGTY